jgi:hypothetical protein
MTVKDIIHHRLHHQQLAKPEFASAAEVVSWLGAVQAQDYLGALWSIGQRMKKAVEADIEQAIADRTIIRTWPMRGTLHFVSPKDVRWMLKYLTPRVISRSASLYRAAGLDKKVLTKCTKLFEKLLQGGKQLTRDEMYAALERAKISTANVRGLHILGHVAQEGLICFGARKGKQQTFTLLDEWIPPVKMPDKPEALAELALRYFTSHGPATVEDFIWWAGLTKADALASLEATKHKLITETVQGTPYWLPAAAAPPKIKPAAHLLPTYDEYGIAYKDRSAFVEPLQYKKAGGPFTSDIVINGKIEGIWKRTIKKDKVMLETKAFTSFNKKQNSAIAAVAKQYGKFVGMDCIVQSTVNGQWSTAE